MSEWKDISQGAKDLLTKMLLKDTNHRISAHEALQDNWIVNNQIDHVLDSKVLDNLQQF